MGRQLWLVAVCGLLSAGALGAAFTGSAYPTPQDPDRPGGSARNDASILRGYDFSHLNPSSYGSIWWGPVTGEIADRSAPGVADLEDVDNPERAEQWESAAAWDYFTLESGSLYAASHFLLGADSTPRGGQPTGRIGDEPGIDHWDDSDNGLLPAHFVFQTYDKGIWIPVLDFYRRGDSGNQPPSNPLGRFGFSQDDDPAGADLHPEPGFYALAVAGLIGSVLIGKRQIT